MFGLTVPSPLITSWTFPLAETTQKLEGSKQVDEPPQAPNWGETKQKGQDRRSGETKEEIQLKHFYVLKLSDDFNPSHLQIHINCNSLQHADQYQS